MSFEAICSIEIHIEQLIIKPSSPYFFFISVLYSFKSDTLEAATECNCMHFKHTHWHTSERFEKLIRNAVAYSSGYKYCTANLE